MSSLTVEPKTLASVLAGVKSAINTRSAIQAHSGVKITANTAGNHVTATDHEVFVERSLPGEREGDIEVLVSHAEMAKVAKVFAKHEAVALTPSSDGTELVCASGNRTVTLPALRLEDFPEFPNRGGKLLLEANGEELAATLLRASTFASKDETRPVLCGIQIDWNDEPVLVATDSYRLCAIQCPGELMTGRGTENTVTIPSRGLTLAAKGMRASGKVTVTVNDRWAIIQHHDPTVTWAIRVTDGQYPNYRQLMPDSWPNEITMRVSELLEACEVAVQFSAKNAPARLYTNGVVKLHGNSPDGPAYEEVLADAKAYMDAPREEFEIGLNPEYLRDIARTVDGHFTVVKLISPLRPALFESKQGADKFLLMPIRLNV